MGKLVYDEFVRLEIDDRTLAHLHLVISEKLRRGEPFTFSWAQPPSEGSGRTVLWVHPHATLRITYRHERPRTLSRRWIDVLMESANSLEGLEILPDPDAEEFDTPRRDEVDEHTNGVPRNPVGGDSASA